jgi:hypothetical protein
MGGIISYTKQQMFFNEGLDNLSKTHTTQFINCKNCLTDFKLTHYICDLKHNHCFKIIHTKYCKHCNHLNI